MRDETFIACGVLAFLAALAITLFHCGPALEAKEAEAGYLAQQLKCVDEAKTREEADLCREGVKQRWAKDAGGDR